MRPGFLRHRTRRKAGAARVVFSQAARRSPVFGGFLMALIGLHDAGGEVAPQFRLIGDPGPKSAASKATGSGSPPGAGRFLEVPADDVAEGEVESMAPPPRPHDVEGGRSAEGEDVPPASTVDSLER